MADPSLESAARLAVSWIRPILDDFDGALEAAQLALDGFRRRNEPFTAWASLTVGLLELRLGRHEAARAHLAEASERGGRFGNRWLASVARTLLASLAMRTGHLDEARGLLVESVAGEDSAISIQTVTFCLIASAELALAKGDSRQAALALFRRRLRQRADGGRPSRRLSGPCSLRAWREARPGRFQENIRGRIGAQSRDAVAW